MNKNEVLHATATKFARVHNMSIAYALNLIKSIISDIGIIAQDLDKINHKLKEITMNPVPIKMTPQVISAINGELQYQATLTDVGRADSTDYGVEGQLITLAVYTRRAQEAWTDNAGPEQALDVLRKVAAIAVRALEQYGSPRREGY